MYRTCVLAVLCVGCAKEETEPTPPPGTISLAWTIGSQGCEVAGIVDVAVVADLVDELAVFDCSAGTGTVEGVGPGRYELTVLGREASGLDRYGAEVPSVVVESGADTPLGNVTLSALPADVTVLWVFDDGGLCAQNDVDRVHVRLFDAGDFLGHEAEAACNDGMLVVASVNGGVWSVEAEGLSAAGLTTWTGSSAVTVEPGTPAETAVTLSPLAVP